jgi:hypothetical protein
MKFFGAESAAAGTISEQKLAELIEALHRASETLASGRRAAGRVPVQGFVRVQGLHPSTPTHVVGVYDMSRTGIAIVAPQPIAPGIQFQVLFDRDDGRRPIEVMCTARHSRPAGNAYITGAEFGVSWLGAVSAAILPPTHRPAISTSTDAD